MWNARVMIHNNSKGMSRFEGLKPFLVKNQDHFHVSSIETSFCSIRSYFSA